MLVFVCDLRLARSQAQLKLSKGPGSAPGFFEGQAQLKTVKTRPTPLKKNFDFYGGAVVGLTLVSAHKLT